MSPRLKRQLGYGLLLLAMLALWAWFQWREQSPAPKPIDSGETRAIDGDSFRLGDRTIRLAGIDAPELRQTCRTAEGSEWPCGREARETLARLIAASGLHCEERAADRYRRALAHCRTGDGNVAEAMVRAGLALGARDPRFDEYPAAMAEARQARRGIWQGAHQHPAEWRAAHPRQRRQPRAAARPPSRTN